MIDPAALQKIIVSKTAFSFSRAGGRGGQNVNKLNTKVLACLPIASLSILDPDDIQRLKKKLKNRITGKDEILIQVQEERTQARNREIAVERLVSLISAALRPVKKRKKTKPGASAREERLAGKKKQTEKKKQRRFSDNE